MFAVGTGTMPMFDVVDVVDDDVAEKYRDDDENNQTVEIQNILN